MAYLAWQNTGLVCRVDVALTEKEIRRHLKLINSSFFQCGLQNKTLLFNYSKYVPFGRWLFSLEYFNSFETMYLIPIDSHNTFLKFIYRFF